MGRRPSCAHMTLASNDGSNNWLMYDLTRVAWARGEFAKEFPAERIYRHSLVEEAAALRMVAESTAKDIKSGKIKSPEPSLSTLVKLNEEGLLEAYVLLGRADRGIAQDYAEYRQANRDKLRRYRSDTLGAVKARTVRTRRGGGAAEVEESAMILAA